MRARSFIAVVLASTIAACGGDDTSSTTEPPSEVTTTTASASTTTTEMAGPEALGDEIGELYAGVYAEVVDLLEDRPEPAVALADLSDLKESYVQKFVALGRQREALSASDRAVVDAQVSAALRDIPDDVFAAYQEAVAFYGDDRELNVLIAGFNIIGQYANFDLLREQAPEEAERLGID